MKISVTNTSYTAHESFALSQHHGGEGQGHPDVIQQLVDDWDAIDSGEWLMVVDGELHNLGLTAPYQIEAYDL